MLPQELQCHTKAIMCIKTLKNSEAFLSCGQDKQMILTSLEGEIENLNAWNLKGAVNMVDFDEGFERIIACNMNQQVILLKRSAPANILQIEFDALVYNVEFDHFNKCNTVLVLHRVNETNNKLELYESDELQDKMDEKHTDTKKGRGNFASKFEEGKREYEQNKTESRHALDSLEFQWTETQGKCICANFIEGNRVLVGTDNGHLVKVKVESGHTFDKEQVKGKHEWKETAKIADSISKIFFNQSRSLLVATSATDDSFVLVNVATMEVIHREKLNREKFSINCVCFNPFFEMNDDEMKEQVQNNPEKQPSETRKMLEKSRQHIYIVGGISAAKVALEKTKNFDLIVQSFVSNKVVAVMHDQHFGTITSVDISNDGLKLITGGHDGKLKIAQLDETDYYTNDVYY